MQSGFLAGGGMVVFILVLALVLLATGAAGYVRVRRLELNRSVLVHAPPGRAWEFVRHLPTLHERHGKARDLCRIRDWTLRHGDGERDGTVWRAHGAWDGAPYWADLEIVRAEPGRELAFALRRDSLGTHRGLRRHHGSLKLEAVGPDATKLTWSLRADLRGPRLILARMSSRPRLQARLFDQGLRSLKVAIDNAGRGNPESGGRASDRSRQTFEPPHPAPRIPPGPETTT
ncbi:MAG: SRPBCC family protein [Acidobacteria bacterium]|nr:SRPBCC family protein [Acidobacteriota bacterium]